MAARPSAKSTKLRVSIDTWTHGDTKILTPSISIIIPCFNAEATIGRCLDAVFALEVPGEVEVIVIDDGSTDDSISIIQRYPCQLICLGQNSGAAFARNRGLERAIGEFIFFADSDVVLPRDALKIALTAVVDADCVVGVFSAENSYDNFCSQYKSLYINFRFQDLNGAATLNTGIALVRRRVLDQVGSFNEGLKTIEDCELGDRIFRHGFKIVIEQRLKAVHLKYFSMVGLFQSDFRKALGLAELLFTIMRAGQWSPRGEFTDISISLMLNVPIVYGTLGVLLVAATGWLSPVFVVTAVGGGILFYLNNTTFWAYLNQRKGLLFAAAAVLFSFLVYVVVGFATIVGLRALVRHPKT